MTTRIDWHPPYRTSWVFECARRCGRSPARLFHGVRLHETSASWVAPDVWRKRASSNQWRSDPAMRHGMDHILPTVDILRVQGSGTVSTALAPTTTVVSGFGQPGLCDAGCRAEDAKRYQAGDPADEDGPLPWSTAVRRTLLPGSILLVIRYCGSYELRRLRRAVLHSGPATP